MTHPDVERLIRKRTGSTTEGERARQIDDLKRYRHPEDDDTDNLVRPLGIELPPGFSKGDGTLTLTPVSSTGYARYIGRAVPRLQAVQIIWRVTTAGTVPSGYAEWGLASSEDTVPAAGLTLNYLTTIGYTDVAGSVTATGRKLTEITDFEKPNAGVHLWLIFIHQGSTGLILRGGVPQEGGFMLSRAGSARPSALVASSQFDEVSTATNDLWCVVKQVQA